MSKGKGLGQLQLSVNNMFLDTATMPPNVKDILNRRGDAIVKSIKIEKKNSPKCYTRNIKNSFNSTLR